MNTPKIFNFVGLVGLIIFALLAYINKYAPQEFFLKSYRLSLIMGLVVVFLVHYTYLVVNAFQQKQWWWAGLLFIAPIPFYWIYFGWVFINKGMLSAPMASKNHHKS